MANQYNNKVVLSNGTTVIDLSTDTVTDASHIMSGHRGHLADGSVVNGTGASESQVVSIEDVPNTTGTTAKITGVAAPEGSISITTNGTHNVYAYETAVVNVSGNTFEFVYSALGSSFTFNSSYADIKAAAQAGKVFDFYYDTGDDELPIAGGDVHYMTNYIFNDDETSTTFSEAVLMTLQSYGEEMGGPELYEVCYGYSSSTLVCKSRRIAFQPMTAPLTVTQNGTYTPPYDDAFYSSVTVNVQGGGSATIQPLTVTSNGTYTAPSGVDGYSPVTVNVSGGGEPTDDGLVTFIDYDGTVLHTYTADEFLALTAMPSNPTHAGLVSQGWNWSLADAKAQVESVGYCVIGQMYNTDDGSTKFHMDILEGGTSFYFGLAPNGTIVVDWGDGSSDTLTGSSLTTLKRQQHTYASAGQYVISVRVSSGSFSVYSSSTGSNYSTSMLTKGPSNVQYADNAYAAYLKAVNAGTGCSFGSYAFYGCRCLATVTMAMGGNGLGIGAFNGCTALKSFVVPSSMTYLGANAFNGCRSLKNFSLPNTITRIEASAFNGCVSIESVVVPNSVTTMASGTFSNCSALKRATLSTAITTIDGTFSQCVALNYATIPASVTSIGANAFRQCPLRTVEIPSGVTTIGSNAFEGGKFESVTVPDGVASLGSYAFNGCVNLKYVTLSSGLTSIGSYAFQNCQALASITIPGTVTSIGMYAFSGCTMLSSIDLPNSVSTIQSYAFSGCKSLVHVSLPGGLTTINTYTFSSCTALESIEIPSTVTNIAANAFSSCYILRSALLPDGLTTIGNNAFTSCSLTNVSIPANASSIGSSPFSSNYSLASITIPDGVTSIPAGFLTYCTALVTLTVPASVTSIAATAFSSCYGMKEYHLRPTTPPTLANTNAFLYIQPDCKIYVPQGSLEAYQTASNWSTYASYMVEEA